MRIGGIVAAQSKEVEVATKRRWAEDITGKRFAVFGVSDIPGFIGRTAEEAIKRRGGVLTEDIDEHLDYLVVGSGRQKGRADAQRKGERLQKQGAKLKLLDDGGFVHLMRVDLDGAKFYFVGGFDLCAKGVDAGQPPALVKAIGAEPVDEPSADIDYVVVGERRAAGKTAALRKVQELVSAGAEFEVIDEGSFFDLIRAQGSPGKSKGLSDFIVQLHSLVDPRRLKRALDMLKKERFNLYADVRDDAIVGVIRSQTATGVYSNVLHADGKYACCSQDLEDCMGLQGQICKHTIVLVLGLVQAGEVDAGKVESWMRVASGKRPGRDPQTLADTLLRYKAAEAGEIDWRPTETVPEDFYAY